jgi:hypothetical protein
MMPIAQQTLQENEKIKGNQDEHKKIVHLHRSNFLVRVILQGTQMKKLIPRGCVTSILMP